MGYWGLVLPSSLGGVSDLAHDAALGNLVKKFVAASSTFDLRSSRLLPSCTSLAISRHSPELHSAMM
jgi:hypothetical protein